MRKKHLTDWHGRGRRLLVGNLGDCAAVLCRGREAVMVSTAHTPGRKDETHRIENAGGWITTERELFMGQLHRMDLSDPSIAQVSEGGLRFEGWREGGLPC
jgi:hypothetical protein